MIQIEDTYRFEQPDQLIDAFNVNQGEAMKELQHLAAWVREQYPEGYLLTWLLNQPGLWWCDGEIYQAALSKDGARLKRYVQKNDQQEMLQGIASKLSHDESWDALAVSLGRIFALYQQELTQLQERRVQQVSRSRSKASDSENWSSDISVQKPLPDPNADPITGVEKS